MKQALQALAEGKVVAAATETFFGLLADAARPAALDALFRIKPRSGERGVPLLLPEREAWLSVAAGVPPLAERLADAFWPGPLTVALPARAGLDERLCVAGTIAVRLAGPSPAAELARRSGLVLTATSANPPGAAPGTHSQQVRAAFASAVLDGGLVVLDGVAPGGQPSTLVAVDGNELCVVRQGRIPSAELERVVAG